MICAIVSAPTIAQARADLATAAKVADLAELRLDYLEEPLDVAALLTDRPCPVIVTNRPARQGGSFAGSESDRISSLMEAIALGAEYVDIEYDAVGRLGDRLGTRIIVSYHDFERTPKDLRSIAQSLLGTGADVIKIATYINDITENFRLRQVAAGLGIPTIVIGMGSKGVMSRILSKKFGSLLTYAALTRKGASAPGQLTVSELDQLYGFRRNAADAKVFGVIANPVAHSISPHIHNAAFRKTGMNAVYVPLEVDALGPFLEGCGVLDFGGFSVTIPHKEAALRLVDEVDDATGRIGAVNTIAVRGGRLVGTNTDCTAAVEAIRSGLLPGEELAGKRALLLGAGGAARAMAFGLVGEGVKVTIANRTFERAERLADEAGCSHVKWEERAGVNADIIANSTSLGMHPAVDVTPMPASALRGGQVVFDAVYNPRETRLIAEAREAGCSVVDGLEMFVAQAVAQFEFWTGQAAPAKVMRDAAKAALGAKEDWE